MSEKTHCNIHGSVNGTMWQGELVCPYHQRQAVDSEGVPYQMYDEFNQDGEEW
jgi:hypothetical protein